LEERWSLVEKKKDFIYIFLLIWKDECPFPTYPWGIRTS